MITMEISFVYETLITYGVQLVMAIIVLLAGLKIISKISTVLLRKMEKAEIDPQHDVHLVGTNKQTESRE